MSHGGLHLNLDIVLPYWRRCRPRILIVTDGQLGFNTSSFGLTRFIEAIAHHSSVTLAPTLTLAHRSTNPGGANVTIPGTTSTYPVLRDFNFATAATPVTVANYDQLWLFGFAPGAFLTNEEIQQIANFMNAGGGVFATGDHGTLGAAMSNRLPRIRRMRDWANVPMGGEPLPGALKRIDTIWNPGPDNGFAFDDQSDDIPQRIFPNYTVTDSGGGGWSASIHPILRMPNTIINRTPPTSGNFNSFLTEFTNDIDVLPDHAHESECFEVSANSNAAEHNATYNDAGMSFQEFPNKSGSSARVEAVIPAFAASGGRAVWNGVWKPPVRPRMFGVNSAFDGHLADPLSAGAARPGRIVCDATWHHYVNINLDGSGSGRTGLGAGSGATFMPSASLLKIYKYYQNIVEWLQPSNRINCWIWWYIDRIRLDPAIIEEWQDIGFRQSLRGKAMLGNAVAGLIDEMRGPGSATDLVMAAIREHEGGVRFLKALSPESVAENPELLRTVVAHAWGEALETAVSILPSPGDVNYEKFFSSDAGHEEHEQAMADALVKGVHSGLNEAAEKTKAAARLAERLNKSVK